jgi:hypothetical protein
VAVVLCLALFLWRPAAAQEAPPSTTTTRPHLTTTSVVQEEGDGPGGLSTGNKVVVLSIGLVVLALLLSVFTWRYWRATKPRPVRVVPEAPRAPPEPARKSAPTV